MEQLTDIMEKLSKFGYIKILPNALSKDFCNRLIKVADSKNWEAALITYGEDQVYEPELRKCSRVMTFRKKITDFIWKLIKPKVEDFGCDWFKGHDTSINPMLRFLKYEAGEYFKSHYDGQYVDEHGNISLITIQIYLNDDFEGGNTIFYDPEDQDDILYRYKPSTGDIILFSQSAFLHSGEEVRSGTKYCVRTEVMVSGF